MIKTMISQPRYLPCLSYLRRIHLADKFILLDTAQRTERGFENRNKLHNGKEFKWLTLPVESSSREIIRNTRLKTGWCNDHLIKIKSWYGGYKHYDDKLLMDLYNYEKHYEEFYDISIDVQLCRLYTLLFCIEDTYSKKRDFASVILDKTVAEKQNGSEAILRLCKLTNTHTYISGMTCLDYGLTIELCEENELYLQLDDWVPTELDKEDVYAPVLHLIFKYGIEAVRKMLRSN